MAFNDLQQKAASEYAVFAAHKNLAKISLFAHTFTELNGRPGESIAVPIYDFKDRELSACEFNADSNNYGTGGSSMLTPWLRFPEDTPMVEDFKPWTIPFSREVF